MLIAKQNNMSEITIFSYSDMCFYLLVVATTFSKGNDHQVFIGIGNLIETFNFYSWYNGYRRRNGQGDPCSNPGRGCFVFHIA